MWLSRSISEDMTQNKIETTKKTKKKEKKKLWLQNEVT